MDERLEPASERPVDRPPSPPRAAVYRLHVIPWLRGLGSRLLVTNWLATTIGCDIWAWRPLDEAELAHELCHVDQWRRYGVRFVARYARASWRAWRAGGDPYRDNVFEVAARTAAAVRAGPGQRPSSTPAARRRRP
ncbi:MAG: hypothetical protein ACXWQ6_03930 [Candidatus Limnocylindrales bacterium]